MPSTQMPANSEPAVGKKFKILPIIFLAVVVVALLGGGAYAGYQYYYLPKQEEGLLKKVYQKMSEVKSLKYDFEVKADVKVRPSPSTDVFAGGGLGLSPFSFSTTTSFYYIVSGKCETDISDKENVRGKMDFSVKSKFDFGSSEACEGLACLLEDFKLGVSAVSFKDVFFLKISELPSLPFFNTSLVLDKWVKFDTSTGTLGQLEELKKTLEEETAKRELSEEEIAKVKKIFGEHDILKIVKRLPDEKIDNHPVYHVSFNLNKEELKAALLESNEAVGGKIISEEQKYDINKVFEDFKIPDSEAWIGKKDYYLYRFSISTSTYGSGGESQTDAKASLVVNLSNFNEPINVEAPAESVSFEKMVEDVFGVSQEQMLNGATGETPRAKMRDAERVADIKQIQTALELFYNDDGAYPPVVDFSGLGQIATGTPRVFYMTMVPGNRMPRNDGNCPDANYSYKVLDNGKSYEISYCLGEDTAGIMAGQHVATPDGIAEISAFYNEFNTSLNDSPPVKTFEECAEELSIDLEFGLYSQEERQAINDCMSGSNSALVEELKQDDDGDGLFLDDELLYGTSDEDSDTDKDGYSDGAEVKSGYNPNGPGKLVQ